LQAAAVVLYAWAMRRVLLALLLLTTPAIADDATSEVLAAVDSYNHGDITTAFRLLRAEAAHGNSDAEVNLGYLYARGQGAAADQQEALRLYRLSAAQDNGEGMNAIGYKYQFGTGVTPNIQTAIDWYCRAIARGNPRALNDLGILYDRGIGVVRDLVTARDLWRQSAERGHVNAAYNLGVSLLAAPAGSDSARQGPLWLQRAAMAGHAMAQQQLRALGYGGNWPPAFDSAAAMTIQPKDLAPGRAPVCGTPIS
jgi:TPR repeat protein